MTFPNVDFINVHKEHLLRNGEWPGYYCIFRSDELLNKAKMHIKQTTPGNVHCCHNAKFASTSLVTQFP